MSPDLRLMLFPVRTYRRLLLDPPRVSVPAAFMRPVLSLMVVGTSTAIWATVHVSVRLVISLMLCWSVVIVIQLAAALALIVPARRQVTLPGAIDLFFTAHGPWSTWLLGSAVWVILSSPFGRPAQFHMSTAAVPAIWTALIIFAFCRVVLACGRREAILRTLLHQAIIWSVMFVLFALAVQLWPRLQAWLA